VHFMLVDSKGDYLKHEERTKLLAAIRSKDPAWQVKGSEGTHRTHSEVTTANLPASITGTEARIQIRLNIVPLDKETKVSSGVIEDWTRAIDEIWNNKYRLRSGDRRLSLVIDPYIAPNIAPPNMPLEVEDKSGRSYVWKGKMHLFLKGQISQGTLPPLTVAHELGHVLGNPDEYSLTPQEYLRFTGTPGTQPRGGESVKGLMGDKDESKAIDKRHVMPAVEIINSVRDLKAYPDEFVVEKA
jgi:hypothetical protein